MKKNSYILKKKLPYILVVFRFVLSFYFPICATYFYDTALSSFWYVAFICLIIAFSDIIDGKIARHTLQSNVGHIQLHRYCDGVADKLGLTIAIIGLWETDRLCEIVFVFLVVREISLLIIGGVAIRMHNETHIRGTTSGKLYYVVLMAFALLLFPYESPIVPIHTIEINYIFLPVFIILALFNYNKHIGTYIFDCVKKIVTYIS